MVTLFTIEYTQGEYNMIKQAKPFRTVRQFFIPTILSLLVATGCAQNDKGKLSGANKGGVIKSETNTVGKTGPSSGTIRGGGASSVNSRSQQGDRANFNYLPGNGNGAANDTSDITMAGLKDPNNLLSQRVIYFDYDKAAIRPEYLVLINTHAKLLAKYPNLKMRLEGHADERGSREYNVALSAERAKSVKQLMGANGARSNQIRTIGYGEEVPLVTGHGERSWQKNRRVEIKYEGIQ